MDPSSSRVWCASPIVIRWRTWLKKGGTWRKWCCLARCAGISRTGYCFMEIKPSSSNSKPESEQGLGVSEDGENKFQAEKCGRISGGCDARREKSAGTVAEDDPEGVSEGGGSDQLWNARVQISWNAGVVYGARESLWVICASREHKGVGKGTGAVPIVEVDNPVHGGEAVAG